MYRIYLVEKWTDTKSCNWFEEHDPNIMGLIFDITRPNFGVWSVSELGNHVSGETAESGIPVCNQALTLNFLWHVLTSVGVHVFM